MKIAVIKTNSFHQDIQTQQGQAVNTLLSLLSVFQAKWLGPDQLDLKQKYKYYFFLSKWNQKQYQEEVQSWRQLLKLQPDCNNIVFIFFQKGIKNEWVNQNILKLDTRDVQIEEILEAKLIELKDYTNSKSIQQEQTEKTIRSVRKQQQKIQYNSLGQIPPEYTDCNQINKQYQRDKIKNQINRQNIYPSLQQNKHQQQIKNQINSQNIYPSLQQIKHQQQIKNKINSQNIYPSLQQIKHQQQIKKQREVVMSNLEQGNQQKIKHMQNESEQMQKKSHLKLIKRLKEEKRTMSLMKKRKQEQKIKQNEKKMQQQQQAKKLFHQLKIKERLQKIKQNLQNIQKRKINRQQYNRSANRIIKQLKSESCNQKKLDVIEQKKLKLAQKKKIQSHFYHQQIQQGFKQHKHQKFEKGYFRIILEQEQEKRKELLRKQDQLHKFMKEKHKQYDENIKKKINKKKLSHWHMDHNKTPLINNNSKATNEQEQHLPKIQNNRENRSMPKLKEIKDEKKNYNKIRNENKKKQNQINKNVIQYNYLQYIKQLNDKNRKKQKEQWQSLIKNQNLSNQNKYQKIMKIANEFEIKALNKQIKNSLQYADQLYFQSLRAKLAILNSELQ